MKSLCECPRQDGSLCGLCPDCVANETFDRETGDGRPADHGSLRAFPHDEGYKQAVRYIWSYWNWRHDTDIRRGVRLAIAQAKRCRP